MRGTLKEQIKVKWPSYPFDVHCRGTYSDLDVWYVVNVESGDMKQVGPDFANFTTAAAYAKELARNQPVKGN